MGEIYSQLGVTRRHPYTGEVILSYSEVRTVVERLAITKEAVILGGDVLTLADKHTYDNWYYEPNETIPWPNLVAQSCEHTLQYIGQLDQPDKKHYILVLTERSK